MTHASNVCGTILDLEGVGRFCKEHHLAFIIDSASAGFWMDIRRLNACHRLYRASRASLVPRDRGFVIKDELAQRLATLIEEEPAAYQRWRFSPTICRINLRQAP